MTNPDDDAPLPASDETNPAMPGASPEQSSADDESVQLAPAKEEPPMEIHKPKPVHSWREQVSEAKGTIATEMADNMARAIWRMRTASCTERRLDELTAILDNASKSGSLPPVGDIGAPPRGTWEAGGWESVVASQAAAHFPHQLLADLASGYKVITRIDGFSADEIAAWNILYTMVGPGRRLDPASEARLREALSQARSTNRLMAILSNLVLVSASKEEFSFSPTDLEHITQAKNEPLMAPRSALLSGVTPGGIVCAPLGKVPPLYGQSMLGAAAPLMDDALKTLPDFSGSAR